MVPARPAILAHLDRAARARSARFAALRVVETLLVLAILLAAGSLVLLAAPGLRGWVLLALGCVAIVGGGLALTQLLRRPAPGAIARWIARREPVLGGALADAVEFSEAAPASEPSRRADRPGHGSPELAQAHVEQAAERARNDSPERHARLAVPRLPLAKMALAILVAGVLLGALPEARRTLVHGPLATGLDILSYDDVELTFRYPAYLRLPERVESGTGDIVAPVGTHVSLRVRADRPLRVARLDGPDGPVEMSVEGAVATGQLVVTKDGTWSAHLEALGGATDPEPPRHQVRALIDGLPDVQLRMPAADSVILAEGEDLQIAWSASDDHGLAEIVEVVVRVAGEAAAPEVAPEAAPATQDRRRIEVLEPPLSSRSGQRSLSAWDLGLEEGRDVEIWIEARDDDEISGPKWAPSRRIRVSLSPARERDDEADALTNVVAEQLLAALAAHLVAAPTASAAAAQLQERDVELSRDVGEAMTSLTRVLAGLQRTQHDLVATSALEEMRGRLDWMLRTRRRRMDDAAAGQGDQAARLRAAATALHPAEIEELERDVLFFDMWADRRASHRAVDSAQALLEAIQKLQDALATQQSEAVGPEARAALAETQAQADAIRPQIDELAQAAGDPERSGEAREALEALRAALERELAAQAKGDLPGAREVAAQMERAASSLADLVDELARAGELGDPELAAELGRADAEIRRMRRQQADLRDQTNELRDDAQETLSPEDRKEIDETFKELLELAEQAVAAEAKGERILGEAPSIAKAFARMEERARIETRLAQLEELSRAGEATIEERAERDLLREKERAAQRARSEQFEDLEALMRLSQAARDSLGRLRQVLADRQIEAARTPARWSLGALGILGDELTRQDRDDLAAAKPSFDSAAARASEILSRLDELARQIEQATQSRMTDAQRQQMDGLGRAQAELLGQARQLSSRVREMGADAPFLDEAVGGALDEAGEQMNEASRRLHGRRPGDASEAQGEAMARLDEASKALSPSPSERPGDRPGGRRPGQRAPGDRGRDSRAGRFSRDEVKIPDAEDYRVPKEFREEILAAMRASGAPAGYEEQVREYYRRLVE